MWKASKILLLILLLLVKVSLSQTKSNSKENQAVEVGFSSNLFNQVDTRDATVAIQLWGKELTESLGMNYFPNTKIFDNTNDIINSFKQNELDLITILTTEYFQISKKIELEPFLINSTDGKYGISFIILVRKDKGIESLDDLKNKSLNIPSNTYGKLITMWLETSLYKRDQKYSSFFSEIKIVGKPSQAILHVFFNQIDACVIPEESFKTMLELNPQLKNELVIIERSPDLVSEMLCLKKNIRENIKVATLDLAQKLSQTVSGKQILSLFRSEGFLEFKLEYIKATKELIDKYEEIQ